MWRSKRRLSQLDLASLAGVSSRHLSFVETGRSKPSREMVLHLAEHLDVPLRDRNVLLTAAGFAPVYQESAARRPRAGQRPSGDRGHPRQPRALPRLRHRRRVEPPRSERRRRRLPGSHLTRAPRPAHERHHGPACIRVGLSRFIVNFDEYAAHVIERLNRQLAATSDPGLEALLDEVSDYPDVARAVGDGAVLPPPAAVLPMHFRLDDGTELRFFSTMTVFGSPLRRDDRRARHRELLPRRRGDRSGSLAEPSDGAETRTAPSPSGGSAHRPADADRQITRRPPPARG